MDTGRATTKAHSPHPLPTIPVSQTGFPYDTTNRPAKAVYSRGGGGRDAGLGPLWPPVRAHHHLSSPYLKGIGPCGRPASALAVARLDCWPWECADQVGE